MRLALAVHGQNSSSGSELPDIVMIHGTGANAALWQDEIDLLVERGHRCFVPDLRGHGDTHEPGEPTGLEEYVGDILETLEGSGVRYPAIWIGHSLGAVIAVTVAERHSELVSEILAVAMPGRVLMPVHRMFEFILNTPYEVLKGSILHRSLSRRQQIMVDTPRHSLTQILNTMVQVDFTREPLKVNCPVHFCAGRMDLLAPYFYVEQMHRLLANSTLKIFEWSGHCVMDDAAGQYREWLLDRIQIAVRQPETAVTS